MSLLQQACLLGAAALSWTTTLITVPSAVRVFKNETQVSGVAID